MAVTKAGAALVASLLAADSLWIAFGDDDGSVLALANTNTTLGNEIDREAATLSRITTVHANDTLRAVKTFTITAANAGTAKEIGILDAASTGTLLCRIILGTARTLTAGMAYGVIIDVPALLT